MSLLFADQLPLIADFASAYAEVNAEQSQIVSKFFLVGWNICVYMIDWNSFCFQGCGNILSFTHLQFGVPGGNQCQGQYQFLCEFIWGDCVPHKSNIKMSAWNSVCVRLSVRIIALQDFLLTWPKAPEMYREDPSSLKRALSVVIHYEDCFFLISAPPAPPLVFEAFPLTWITFLWWKQYLSRSGRSARRSTAKRLKVGRASTATDQIHIFLNLFNGCILILC